MKFTLTYIVVLFNPIPAGVLENQDTLEGGDPHPL